jgi:hypothetical protein
LREGRPRGETKDEHQEVRISRRREHQRRAPGSAEAQARSVDPRTAPFHPQPQSRRLVMLELEQVQHEVQPAGEQDEQARSSRRQSDGRHRPAASRGCSSRKRRATARNWPGASA